MNGLEASDKLVQWYVDEIAKTKRRQNELLAEARNTDASKLRALFDEYAELLSKLDILEMELESECTQ